MKSYKNIALLIGILLSFLIFNACAPIQKIEARKYGGAANTHINIQQKKDIQATGSQVLSVTGSENNTVEDPTYKISLDGYQGTLSYGLTNNLALSGSFNYLDHQSVVRVGNKRNGDGYFDYVNYTAKAVSADYKGAVHYYLIDTLGRKGRWKFGQYYGAGIGLGTTVSNGDLHRLAFENNIERTWIRGVHDSNYYQLFLHSNHSLMNRIFDISFSNNFSILRNNLKAGQLSISEKSTNLIWQPSLRTSLGYKPVKLFAQLDLAKPLNNQFLSSDVYLYASLGLQVKLHAGKF